MSGRPYARLGVQALVLLASCLLAQSQGDIANAACLGEVFAALGFTVNETLVQTTKPDHCLRLAQQQPPEPEFLAKLQPRSRKLPPREPALAAYDWHRVVHERPPGWPNPPVSQCPSELNKNLEILRVKVYNGIIYAHHAHNDTSTGSRPARARGREKVFEMLMLINWFYKDVPDMDLAFNTVDHAINCDWPIPQLQFVAINMTSPTTGEVLDVNPDHYACKSKTAMPDKESCVGYSKGFTIPTPDAYSQLTISPRQLWWYAFCTHSHYMASIGGPSPFTCKVPRKPIAFWRGSASGIVWGWSPRTSERWQAKYNSWNQSHFLLSAMLNKRISLALMAQKYPWMDVGITSIPPIFLQGFKQLPENDLIDKLLVHAASAPFLCMERWNRHHLSLNIDGMGPAYRMPRLMLANVPVLKIESPLREWFIEHATPGVHYEPARYDLSDVVERSRSLVEEAQRDSTRFEKMAVNAAKLVVEKTNLFAQLDAIAWSFMRAKEAAAWQVLPPEGAVSMRPEHAGMQLEPGWHLVKIARNRTWHASSLPENIKANIMQQFRHNFEDA